jgi:hypothetical protein
MGIEQSRLLLVGKTDGTKRLRSSRPQNEPAKPIGRHSPHTRPASGGDHGKPAGSRDLSSTLMPDALDLQRFTVSPTIASVRADNSSHNWRWLSHHTDNSSHCPRESPDPRRRHCRLRGLFQSAAVFSGDMRAEWTRPDRISERAQIFRSAVTPRCTLGTDIRN